MSSSLGTPSKRHYVPAEFQNRTAELGKVENLVQQLLDGKAPPERTILFEGDRNMGKSWLSYHLVRDYLPARFGPEVMSLLYPFDQYPKTGRAATQAEGKETAREWTRTACLHSAENTEEPNALIQDILCWTLKAFNAFGGQVKEATVEERTEWLIRCVAQRSSAGGVSVFIFDSISEVDPSILERLEQAMLAPLAKVPTTVIVMTGRPPLPNWVSTELRVHVSHKHLGHFKTTEVQGIMEVVAPQRLDLVGDIEDISGGNPGVVTRLATLMVMDQLPLEKALDQVIEEQLDVFDNEDDRQAARRTFEQLCVLDEGFREAEMERFLPQLGTKKSDSTTVTTARNLLAEAHLLRWEQGALRLDDSIRHLVEEYLKRADPARWQRLHQQAAKMYEEYATQYSRWKDSYDALSRGHREEASRLNLAH